MFRNDIKATITRNILHVHRCFNFSLFTFCVTFVRFRLTSSLVIFNIVDVVVVTCQFQPLQSHLKYCRCISLFCGRKKKASFDWYYVNACCMGGCEMMSTWTLSFQWWMHWLSVKVFLRFFFERLFVRMLISLFRLMFCTLCEISSHIWWNGRNETTSCFTIDWLMHYSRGQEECFAFYLCQMTFKSIENCPVERLFSIEYIAKI